MNEVSDVNEYLKLPNVALCIRLKKSTSFKPRSRSVYAASTQRGKKLTKCIKSSQRPEIVLCAKSVLVQAMLLEAIVAAVHAAAAAAIHTMHSIHPVHAIHEGQIVAEVLRGSYALASIIAAIFGRSLQMLDEFAEGRERGGDNQSNFIFSLKMPRHLPNFLNRHGAGGRGLGARGTSVPPL